MRLCESCERLCALANRHIPGKALRRIPTGYVTSKPSLNRKMPQYPQFLLRYYYC